MALGRARRSKGGFDYWPGFVDALSTMLLVIIFLLSVFMLAQYFLSREMTGKDTALQRLNRQIEELTSLLALERAGKGDSQTMILSLQATLEANEREKQRLQGLADANRGGLATAGSEAIDQTVYDMAQKKMRDLFVIYHSMKEAAVDCMILHKFHGDASVKCE